MRKTSISIILVIGMLIALVNCRRDKNIFDTSSSLSFSTDTILFDTLFTTIGSTTKRFKIYNNSNKKINISSINLGQGTQSMFRINVNGFPGTVFENVEIPQKDSIFVFVEVTIDPNNGTNPMIVEDQINFLTNGKEQSIVLNAFGQDAYFHVSEIITTDTNWPNDKPHVIYNYVAVDSAQTLTIPGGTSIHSFNNSFLYIYKSSLIVQGSLGNEVTFEQSRTEEFILAQADSVAGQWRGIYMFAPQNSSINYTKIKNATIGIQIDTLEGVDSVILENVRIDNSSFAALVTQGGNIYANSCLFGNSGSYSAFLSIGGSVYFDHCTFGNHWLNQRNTVLFALKDYYSVNNTIFSRPFSKAIIKNSIIYGNNDNEIAFDTLSRSLTGGVAPNFFLSNCLIKSEDPVSSSTFYNSCWRNIDPNFADPVNWDFHTNNSSSTNQKGTDTNPISDLDGNSRSASGNDLGVYNTP